LKFAKLINIELHYVCWELSIQAPLIQVTANQTLLN